MKLLKASSFSTRRALMAAMAMGAIAAGRKARAADATGQAAPSGGGDRMHRPMKGDRLVFSSGPEAGKPIRPEDLAEGGPQVLVWASDPATGTVRDGSRLNQILAIRLPMDSLQEGTREHAAGGVVAYSAVCSHAQCPVTEWRPELGRLHCPCHNSEYDPRDDAKVVNGPAQRKLAALPLALEGGTLVVAEPFIGKVGAAPAT